MAPSLTTDTQPTTVRSHPVQNAEQVSSRATVEVAILSGGVDRHYAFGLAMALIGNGAAVEFIGGDEVDSPELHSTEKLTFVNLRRAGRGAEATLTDKAIRIIGYYARLIRYAATAKPRIFHILWNNKFQFFDRTLLTLYYRLLGKKVVLTAHNVNEGTRDSNDSRVNRFTLRMQYRLASHIFVHTTQMKQELMRDFGVHETAVTIIPYGINNAVPNTTLSPLEAKRQLGVGSSQRTLLFFGNVVPYKGLEYLVAAFERLVATGGDYRLIIAGRVKHGCGAYWDKVQQQINAGVGSDRIIQRTEFIPDQDTELYFKAADVLVLPYCHIFQSGVLFLGYRFGLPAVAADVGSLHEDIVEGKTGYMVRAKDPADLAAAIEKYFASELCQRLDERRREIQDYVAERHSWNIIGRMTRNIYDELLGTT